MLNKGKGYGKENVRKRLIIKVDLCYCSAERMQNKAETLKHETQKKKRCCSICRASGGRWRDQRRGEEAEDEEQGGSVREVAAYLYKSLSTLGYRRTVYSLCKCRKQVSRGAFCKQQVCVAH